MVNELELDIAFSSDDFDFLLAHLDLSHNEEVEPWEFCEFLLTLSSEISFDNGTNGTSNSTDDYYLTDYDIGFFDGYSIGFSDGIDSAYYYSNQDYDDGSYDNESDYSNYTDNTEPSEEARAFVQNLYSIVISMDDDTLASYLQSEFDYHGTDELDIY